MNLLKCPRCGEEYSPSYRRCPFCEEGDHPRKIKYNSSKQSGGRRVSDKKQTQSVRGAMAAVLVVVLLLLSWSLFGDKIVAKITPADDGNTPGVQDDVNTPDDSNTNTDDPNANNGDTTDPNTGDEPNANDPANGSDTTATNPGTTTTPSTPTVDASALSIKTNVGTTLPKDANGNFDCTIKSSETIRLSVSGTDAAATWAVADASVHLGGRLDHACQGRYHDRDGHRWRRGADHHGAHQVKRKRTAGGRSFLRKKGRLSLQALPACATITLKKYLQELSTI